MLVDTESVEAFTRRGNLFFAMQSFWRDAMSGGGVRSPELLMSNSDEIIFLALGNRDMTL